MYLPPALDIANSASSLGGAAAKTANKIYENVSEYLKSREGTSAKIMILRQKIFLQRKQRNHQMILQNLQRINLNDCIFNICFC